MATTDERIDQLLREDAARWQAAQRSPAPARPLATPSRSRTWPVMASAAAVAALLLGSVSLAWLGHRPASPEGSGGAVVAWKPLKATHPHIPARRVALAPDPAAAARARACTAADLDTSAEVASAAGTTYDVITFTGRGDVSCRLEGRPVVRMLSSGAAIPVTAATQEYGKPVLVGEGRTASLKLQWSNWCTQPVHNRAAVIILPGNGGRMRVPGFGQSPPCVVSGGPSTPSPVAVPTFAPSDTSVRWQSRFAGVTVVLSGLPQHAHAHHWVRFRISMTATGRDVPLRPCPDYVIRQSTGAAWVSQAFALNCAGVPTQDADGTPVLKKGRTVTFKMRARTVGVIPGEKLVWQLQVPDSGTGVGLAVPAAR